MIGSFLTYLDKNGEPRAAIERQGAIRTAPVREVATPVVLTVDTEPDDAWTDHHNSSLRNVPELLTLQKLLDQFGAKATLLVTYKVIQDDASRDVLLRMAAESGAEVGAHLHPWETPPFLPDGRDFEHRIFPHELPAESFRAKLERLTEAIAERMGCPTSYRAGRWGIVGEHLRVLEALGYVVDSSVTAWTDWRDTPGVPYAHGGRGGVDYRLAPCTPYHPDYGDVCQVGPARILEVPVTVGFTRRVPPMVRRIYPYLPELAKRVLRKCELLRVVEATPGEGRNDHLVQMLREVIAERRPIINISLHSSELMTGGSPLSRTPAQTRRVFERIRLILEALTSAGPCRFATLSEVAANARHFGLNGHSNGRAKAALGRIGVQADIGRHRTAVSVRLTDSSGLATRAQPAAPDSRTRPPVRLAYILAASHSGSTLTAMLLAAHPQVCTVGELQLGIRSDVDRYRCSCGQCIRQCAFWTELRDRMGRSGEPLDFDHPRTDVRAIDSRYVQWLLRPLHRSAGFELMRDAALACSSAWRDGLPAVQRRTALLAREVCALAGGRVIVDTSKSALRLKYLLRNPDLDVRIVRLLRDGRGVALTYYLDEKRLTMPGAAHEWRRSNEEAEALLRGVERSKCIEVRYEAICENPLGALRRLHSFLGLDPDHASIAYRAKPHHVVGNCMRLEAGSEIALDDRWKTQLSAADLREFDRVAGRLNRRYGY